jgi:hypothetical protein
MSEESPSPPPVPRGTRASDEDRERLVSELNAHTVAGRLDTDELEERTQAAYSARTTAELDALREDLPATKAELDRAYAERRSHLTKRMIQETGGSAALFVVSTAVWLLSGATGQFWPAWVLVIVVLSLAHNLWALYGPAADLDDFERQLNARRSRHRHHDRRHQPRRNHRRR